MKKGVFIPGKMIILVIVILIALLIVGVILLRIYTPTLETSHEARASYFAHSLASSISALSSMDKGYIERDFEGLVDVEIKRYSWLGTILKLRTRPAVYYMKVTVYKEGKKETKKFTGTDLKKECESHCLNIKCICKSCQKNGECLIVNLVKSEESEDVPFIGRIETSKGGDSIEITEARFIELRKDSKDGGVTVKEVDSVSFCTEPTEGEVKQIIDTYSTSKKGQSIDKNLIKAVITKESEFRHCDSEGNVKPSFSGVAYGIMQLVPTTAKWIGDLNSETLDYNNPIDNMKAGILYLHYLREERLGDYTEGEDLDKAMVACYNCDGVCDLVKNVCKKGVSGCWDKIEPYIFSAKGGTYCQSGKEDQTFNHVREVFKYKGCFEKNPDCNYACRDTACEKRVFENE